ncbi:peptidoglycan-binding domain-containing protein [Streptomyces sp. NPDC052299]|uniref:peptidoglycan-binding domain-containing protein n=1 Tax=Streptomyces sp. NPDC052299 TaxID=3155054 RepID=UPI0034436C6E
MTRKLYVGATAIALALAGALTISTPASASASSGYISGTGSVLDDLNDEGPLHYGDRSGAVAVWQTILWNDGYLGPYAADAVDCSFGADTLAATKKWQKAHGLTADGVPGKNTFTKAGKYLKDAGTNIYGQRIIRYDSPQSSYRPLADRDASGHWIVWIGTTERHAYYDHC